MGAIPRDLAEKIYENTKVNVLNYNLTIGANEIRKIFKDHGDEKRELLRGQRNVTDNDVANIPYVVLNSDKIILSKDTYMGKPVISFVKQISQNDTVTVSAVVSSKHLDLFVQTQFINTKKGNLATPIDEHASINTPEASSSTVSSNSIHDYSEESKGKVQKSAAEVPTYAMMPKFGDPLNVNYTGEGYTAENGLKLFTKYSVDTARDFIMGELMLSEGKISLAKDLNEFYTFIIQIKGTHTINQKKIR